MKKILLIVACFCATFSYAQLPPNSFGEDFTITDINGQEHNLYDVLDEGKTVILDLFAVWCGPCWDFAATGVLEDLQAAYPNEVVVMAIEADASTAESTIYGGGNSIGDWTTMIDYMMADDPTGDIANDYALAYYPTIYKICPDRMVTEVGQLGSVSAFYSEIQSCSQATFSKDMKILNYNGVGAHCNGTAYPSVKVQNYSLGSNVYSFNVKTLENGQEISSTPWSGNLSTYETANVSLGPISGFSGTTGLTFEIEYSGDQDDSNNTASTTLSTVSQQSSADVTLNITTDGWGYETAWTLQNMYGDIIDGEDGTLANNESYEWNWSLGTGCYIFTVTDSYGDGVAGAQWGDVDGVVSLQDDNYGTLWEGVDFGNEATLVFEVSAELDIEEEMENSINVYPNPSKDYTNIYLNLSTNKSVNINIYNTLGQLVDGLNKGLMSAGNHNIKLDVDHLVEGLYYIEINLGDETKLTPINIVR